MLSYLAIRRSVLIQQLFSITTIQNFWHLFGHDVVGDNQGQNYEAKQAEGCKEHCLSTPNLCQNFLPLALTSMRNSVGLLQNGKHLPGHWPSLAASHVRWHVIPWTTLLERPHETRNVAGPTRRPTPPSLRPGGSRSETGRSVGERGPGVALQEGADGPSMPPSGSLNEPKDGSATIGITSHTRLVMGSLL
jgi:hypothetical protein